MVRDGVDEPSRTDAPLTVRTIDTEAEATHQGFTGTPSLLVNGSDPFAEPGLAPALACRVSFIPSGPRGLPEAAAVRAALHTAEPTRGSTR